MASSVSVIATTTNHASQHHMDRLDAARALLGVSPSPQTSEPTSSSNNSNNNGMSRLSASNISFVVATKSPRVSQPTSQHSQETPATSTSSTGPSSSNANTSTSTSPSGRNRMVSFEQPSHQRFELAPPAVVISTGLDALAALASSEQASWELRKQQEAFLIVSASTSSSSDDDSEAMPPPPPRVGGRRRSVSNPEGMEKWAPSSSARRHFVLPASILEEELAEANAAMEAHERHNLQLLGAIEEGQEQQQKPAGRKPAPVSGLLTEEEQANLTPEELLKRARSRLLEDLSEGSLNGEKGVLTLPHSLSKYKEVRFHCRVTAKPLLEEWSSQTMSNNCFPFFLCRSTTRTAASVSTLLLNEPPLLLVSIASDHVGYGTKRFDTIVARI
jgi:hypothetical protein